MFAEMKASKSWKPATQAIKNAIGQLGVDSGYSVYSSGVVGAEGGEWLYDMVWLENENGYMRDVILTMESELRSNVKIKDAARVDDDFLKLIQSRSSIRIWRTLMPNDEIAQEHIKNCKDYVMNFKKNMDEDIYIFIVSNWSDAETIVERFSPEKG